MATVYRFGLSKGSSEQVRNFVFEIDDAGTEIADLNAAFLTADSFFEVVSSGVVIYLRDLIAITSATESDLDAWKARWNRRPVSSPDGRVHEETLFFSVEAAIAAQSEYAVPAALHHAQLKQCIISHTGSGNRTVSIWAVRSGDSPDESNNILAAFPISQNSTETIPYDRTLPDGDIEVVANGVDVTVSFSGEEVT